MEKAGLTASEMIMLLPIGRATFYCWKRGETISDMLRYRLSIARCKVIEMAVEKGRLPLTEDVPRRMRLTSIQKILSEVKAGR